MPKRKKFIGFEKQDTAIFVVCPSSISKKINCQSGVYSGEGKIQTQDMNSPRFEEVIVPEKS